MKTATTIGLAVLLAGTTAASADYNFQVPDKCWNGSTQQYLVTGADGAESDEPPVVTITYKNADVTSPVTLSYNSGSKIWSASVAFPPVIDTATYFLVTTTYTPFLQSYYAVPYNIQQPFQLPPPSWNNQQILPHTQITVTDQNKTPIPYGFVEMAPNFGGSSPYTLQADNNAKIDIYCFTAYLDGNPATVLDANHNLLYSTTIYLKGDDSGRPAVGVAAPEQ